MQTANDICSLDYLIGTLSTAYKGVITSLVAKDFCMTVDGDTMVLKGRILSMPPGTYEASLIGRGVELARAGLEEGSFAFKTETGQVVSARDLQIDILQQGRHIGTFLLKNEGAGGVYISAVELSEEIRGMDFKLLTMPLREKAGLLQKAEEIIAKIHSTKKDWPAFSELLHGFAYDAFWSARDAFYGGYAILVRFASKAAERTDRAVTAKPVSNVLDLIGLPLQREEDEGRLRSAARIWVSELSGSPIDLSSQLRQAAPLLRALHERCPGADIGPLLARLLGSLRDKVRLMPSMSPSFLDSLRGRMEPEEYALLARYGDEGKRDIMVKLALAEKSLEQRAYGEALEFLALPDPDVLDDGKMIETFLDAAARHLNGSSADAVQRAFSETVSLLPSLSAQAVAKIIAGLPAVMEKLLALGQNGTCESLLGDVGRAGPPITEAIVMNTRTAAVIMDSGNEELIASYRDILTGIVIPAAKVREISTETWAEVVNPLHLERLMKFMDILEQVGGRLPSVLVHVIANLFVSGLFIPDDRLFQRRVSAYLNSGAMRGDFLLSYLLLRKLPVYYHEVGAVSRIRDLSTEIDSWGNDPVLYFVRKQVHVNASNYNVRLIERVLAAWAGNDPGPLQDAVPRDVSASLAPGLLEKYSRVIRPLFESLGVIDAEGLRAERLIGIPEEELRERLGRGQLDEISTKVLLLCRLYQEIVEKYSFVGREPGRSDVAGSLAACIGRMEKNVGIVRSPEKTVAQESLYFKRHIAFGIPSVLGTYHEPKFDALAELLRDDAAIGVLLEEVIAGIQKRERDFSPAEAAEWLHALVVSSEALSLHGLGNRQVEEFVAVSESNSLRLSQAADLLKMWQKELAGMVDFFSRTFHKPLSAVLEQFPKEDLPDYLMNLDPSSPDFTNKAADIVIRDMLSSVPGLVEADRIIESLLRAVTARVEGGADDLLGGGRTDGDRPYAPLHELGIEEAMRLAPTLGSKAKNLIQLSNRGFRVPAGVVFSSRLTAAYRTATDGQEFIKTLRQAVRTIEERTGQVFGNGANPLFLSVRSGSYVSMPGILQTVLYCGMNQETLQGLIKTSQDPRFAWDSYRRFIEHYAAVVMGLEGPVFDDITARAVKAFGLQSSEELDAAQLETVVDLYHDELSRRGLTIPVDVNEQLRLAVRSVYASWYGDRAGQFRRATRTSEYWGTAVMLMQMVYGNKTGAGTSVFFTRNPFTGEKGIYGETRERATGEDLVHGKQRNKSIEETDPELFTLHRKLAAEIEEAMGGLPQEVEVTYTMDEDGQRRIWVLQTRRMEVSAGTATSFEEICRMESQVIGRGLAAHGGARSGVATFAKSPEEVLQLKRQSGMPVILLRTTANTDDVSLMPVIGGIITSSGGVTSHAAVLAAKFGIDAVVACADMTIGADERGEPVARIGGAEVREGSLLSIDGSTGLVFSGICLEPGREERA